MRYVKTPVDIIPPMGRLLRGDISLLDYEDNTGYPHTDIIVELTTYEGSIVIGALLEQAGSHITMGKWLEIAHNESGGSREVPIPPELDAYITKDVSNLLAERYGKPCVQKDSPSDIILNLKKAGFKGSITM